MFDELQEKLQGALKNLRGKTALSEENIESAVAEVKKALIDADVSLKAVKVFTSKVKEKAIGEGVTKGVTPHEQFIKIVNDELINLLGGEQKDLNLTITPTVILMLGLQGSGKTTTCVKLANLLKKKNRKPLLVALDLKRPAAIEQLEILGNQINIPVFSHKPSAISHQQLAKKALDHAKENNFDVVILDSAGRLQIDTEMMAELLLIDRTIQPHEKLLVIDSMIGPEAANIAAAFDTQIGITGIVLTKLDGDARGGAALSVVQETNKPIKLAGIGEKIEDLQEFYPDRMASRILGMGDVLTLVEQAQEKIQEDEAKELERKLLTDFNFESFLQAQNMMGKLGDLSSVFNMMGMGNMLGQMGMNMDKATQEKMLSEGEAKSKKQKALIQSMTIEERTNPRKLTPSRNRRIACGAGMKERDVDKLEEEFRQMKKMMDKIKPLMGMLKGGGAGSGSSPLDALKGSFPTTTKSPFDKPKGGLSKGFKPKKKK